MDMSMSEALALLGKRIEEEVSRNTYELVWVDYRDHLTDEQVDWVMSGDMEEFWSSTMDWESDQQYESAKNIVESLAEQYAWVEFEYDADDVLSAFDGSTEYHDLILSVMDKDSSEWFTDLIRNTPAPLMRVIYSDERYLADESTLVTSDNAREYVTEVVDSLVGSEGNEEAIEELLRECCLVSCYVVPQLLFTPEDLSTILDAEPGDKVVITNPWLLLGDPFQGDGYEVELRGNVTLDRGQIRTDRAAGGYSWSTIAGVNPGSYSCEVAVIKK